MNSLEQPMVKTGFKLACATLIATLIVSLGVIGTVMAQTPATVPAPASKAADPARILVKVDGATITEADLALAAEDLGGGPEAQNREALIGYMIDLRMGAKAALDNKAGDSEDFKRRMAHQRDKLLLEDYLATEAHKAVNPAAIAKLYDETIKSLPPEQEVRARHILVETEDQAKAVLERLNKGEDFAKLSAELSKDPGSGPQGGDLGWFTKERMVPEFAEAAFKLEPGKLSVPVKTQFGWHVLKVEEKRAHQPPKLEDVRDQIAQYLERKAQQDIILGLRAKAKIERLDQPAAEKEAPKKP
jgi:peptidyl-prolyl cis-trans isomerase C